MSDLADLWPAAEAEKRVVAETKPPPAAKGTEEKKAPVVAKPTKPTPVAAKTEKPAPVAAKAEKPAPVAAKAEKPAPVAAKPSVSEPPHMLEPPEARGAAAGAALREKITNLPPSPSQRAFATMATTPSPSQRAFSGDLRPERLIAGTLSPSQYALQQVASSSPAKLAEGFARGLVGASAAAEEPAAAATPQAPRPSPERVAKAIEKVNEHLRRNDDRIAEIGTNVEAAELQKPPGRLEPFAHAPLPPGIVAMKEERDRIRAENRRLMQIRDQWITQLDEGG